MDKHEAVSKYRVWMDREFQIRGVESVEVPDFTNITVSNHRFVYPSLPRTTITREEYEAICKTIDTELYKTIYDEEEN